MTSHNGRDMLAVNNEPCTYGDPGTGGPGGFDLIDVTDPFNAASSSPGVGDGRRHGPDDGSRSAPRSRTPTTARSCGGSARTLYLVTVDNIELHDVDIFDISDPAEPKPVAEHDLVELFPRERGHGPDRLVRGRRSTTTRSSR